MPTYTCRKCGPLTHLDIASVVDYDVARGAILEMRCCKMCDEPVKVG